MSTALDAEKKRSAGMFDRIASLLVLIERMPADLSDEEVDGLNAVLPGDTAGAIGALLAPGARKGGMAFLKMAAEALLGARRAKERGAKIILMPFNFPNELLHAFDNAYPVTSEVLSTLGVAALEGQGERYWDMAMGLGLPDHMCSANTVEIGSVLGSDDFRPDAVISSASGGCDVNAKMHEFLARYHGIPQFILDKPVDDSDRGRDAYDRNTRRLVEQLEEFLGESLSEEKLLRVMENANRCTELYHELWDLHKAVPCPVPNLYSVFTYGTRFTMWGTDTAVETMQALVDTVKEHMKSPEYAATDEVARTLWVYTSYYFDFGGLFNWMQDRGYAHLGDGLDLFFPDFVDTSSRDSMIAGLAKTAWNMPMTRQVGGESMSVAWSEDAIYAATDLKADCAIYCGHHSCKQTWSVVSILREELMKRTGKPLLTLQGDSWIKRMTPIGVLQGEIDGFIKNVVLARRSGKRKVRRMADRGEG